MDLVHRFKNYLEFEAETKSAQPLSQNSRHTYFNKFKACLGQAYRERVIKDNLADYTQGLKQGETQREYLTFEEIKRLMDTECRYPDFKTGVFCLAVIQDFVGQTFKNLNGQT
jgi:hypothetical protein